MLLQKGHILDCVENGKEAVSERQSERVWVRESVCERERARECVRGSEMRRDRQGGGERATERVCVSERLCA
jgi:hypothetical protein